MDLLSVINPITDCKKKSENLDGESIQTTVLVNDDTSEQQTIVANDTTNASQSNDCNKYSDKSTAESGSFDNNQSCTESFIGLWKEIQGFYHIPDSTWYCAPGPINNRISTSAYGGVTSRSRQSAGVGSLNFSRLSTLLAEASSPSLKPATEFRNSTNKSSSYKPSLHDTSHTTAASRAAEAAKQRYLSKKGKNKFSSRKSQLDRNYKTMKQDNKLKNWSKNISRNSLYDCTATSSPSKADHIKRATNRKSQLSDSRSSCISVYKKSVFEREELSDNETDLDNDDSMYEESSTDKQTDTPSSTPSTIAMCISDVEDFLIQDDEKSDKTIPNDDSTTYSTLDNDRPAATIPEDETNDYNSESEKSVSSNAVSSLSTEAVRETDSRVGDRNSSVCSSPTLENITDGPEIAVEEELRLDNVNQKSPVDDIVASSNMNLSAYGILDVANDNPENGMELRTITDIHCSPVLSVDIQVPVENLCSVGSADFVDTDSKMSHSVTYISNIGKSPNVTLSASDVEKVLDKKVDLSSNSAAQAKKVNKSVFKKLPTYSILPFLVKKEINKSPQTSTSDAKSDIEVEHTEKLDMNVFKHEFNKR